MLAERLEVGDLVDGAILRNLLQRRWSGLSERRVAESALRALKQLGWLRLERYQPPGGGRPSLHIRLHPELR